MFDPERPNYKRVVASNRFKQLSLLAKILNTHEFDPKVRQLTDIQARILIEHHFPISKDAQLDDAFEHDATYATMLDDYYEGEIDMSQFQNYQAIDEMEGLMPDFDDTMDL